MADLRRLWLPFFVRLCHRESLCSFSRGAAKRGFQVVEAVQETGSSRRLIGKSLLPGPGAQFHDLYHHIHIRTCLAIFVGSRCQPGLLESKLS